MAALSSKQKIAVLVYLNGEISYSIVSIFLFSSNLCCVTHPEQIQYTFFHLLHIPLRRSGERLRTVRSSSFDKARQKIVCSGDTNFKNRAKYFVLVSRNNPLLIKGLKSVDVKIIQLYRFRLKWKRYTVCTNWWDSNFFGVGLPAFPVGLLLFCQMGVLNSCFQNLSESSDTSNGL